MDKETVAQARKESNEAYLIYATLKIPYLKAEENWLKKLHRFKEFDYQLALTDGRFKRISSGRKCKEKKPPELTMRQLKNIIEKLNIDIPIE